MTGLGSCRALFSKSRFPARLFACMAAADLDFRCAATEHQFCVLPWSNLTGARANGSRVGVLAKSNSFVDLYG